jgi:UDP-N-acetylglucosamine 2-epimerase (non-hydrolysing)
MRPRPAAFDGGAGGALQRIAGTVLGVFDRCQGEPPASNDFTPPTRPRVEERPIPKASMTPVRIAVFIGTRPEAVKLSPVVRALQAAAELEPIVINTGQHRELLEPTLRSLELDVAHALDVMRPDQKLADLTARLLVACDDVLGRVAPQLAVVQGDTTTVLAACLACFYRRIPVAHVEAGLRTHDPSSPFPEELNRAIAARLCSLHFAPTERAKANLLAEGIAPERISVTGNTVIDALLAELERQRRPEPRAAVERELEAALGSVTGRPIVLVTGHRRENFGRGLEQLCAALAALATRFEHHDFVYPVHLNPNVRELVHERLRGLSNVKLIAPLAYAPFVALMQACHIVLTDSGGIQEEAPSLGKPVLVMRDTTERPEAVEAGTVRLVEPSAERIVQEVTLLLTDRAAHARMASRANPYGDGHAAARIVERLRAYIRENA